MAAVKTLSRTIVDALGVPLVGKTSVLKNNATGATIATTTTDANGVYSFPDRDETLRYRVEVSPGGASTQVYRASPADAEFGHLYAMDSLRTAAGAVVAFGGAVSMGALAATTGAFSGAVTVGGTVTAPTLANQIGVLGATVATGPVTEADAAIQFYRFSATNWSGIGGDGSGNMWWRTGLSGAPAPTLMLAPDGMVMIQRNTLTAQAGFIAQAAVPTGVALRAVQPASAATTLPFATFELSGGQIAWGARGDGIVCDVAATSISLGPSPTRMLRVWNTAGTLLGYLPIHPGA